MNSQSRGWKFVRLVAVLLGFILTGGLAPKLPSNLAAQNGSLGLFESQTDVGETLAGSAAYDPATRSYRVTGGGANMWEGTDAFHYVWRRASGNMIVTSDVVLQGTGGVEHRKAGIVIRQSLDPDSPYVDAVIHGNGLTAMQFRETKGATTKQVQSPLSGPLAVRLERQGDTFTLSAAMEGKPFETAGSTEVKLTDPVYVGIAVCAHDAKALETAVFSDVHLEGDTFYGEGIRFRMQTQLEIMSVDGKHRRTIYSLDKRFEAPNWSRDGKYLLFNQDGRLYTIPAKGGTSKVLDTGSITHCNNDHGFSADGKWLAISSSPPGEPSHVYVLPATGGEPREVVSHGPAYWHGWSPDGKTLAFVGEHDGNFDIYTVPIEGGAETRLTNAAGLDDGPEYSPDGKFIYFNSERSGLMQIWRMDADGSKQVQVTHDNVANWFAHLSPNGKWMVMITFEKNVKTHPPNQHVQLRIVAMKDGQPVGEPRVVASFFGGQGSFNVPSWSPDSKSFAFVSYRLLGN